MVKPANRSMSSPAACTAAKMSWVRKPSVSPAPTCMSVAMMSGPTSGAGALAATCGATGIASATANAIFAWVGSMRLLNGGETTSQADARTTASTKPRTRSVDSARVIGRARAGRAASRSYLVGQPRDHLVQPLGERDHLGEHPVAGEEQDQGDRRELRDEGQRHLLDLGDGLQQRDPEADREGHEQDRRAELRGDDDRLEGDLEDGGVRHGCPRLRRSSRATTGRPAPTRRP